MKEEEKEEEKKTTHGKVPLETKLRLRSKTAKYSPFDTIKCWTKCYKKIKETKKKKKITFESSRAALSKPALLSSMNPLTFFRTTSLPANKSNNTNVAPNRDDQKRGIGRSKRTSTVACANKSNT